jgi:N,N-dimethylformamidase
MDLGDMNTIVQEQLPIAGYLDCLSRRPGEQITAFVSVNSAEEEYDVNLVRVICGDPNPAGPGMRFEDLSERFKRRLQGSCQPISIGSYGIVPSPQRAADEPFTWTLLFQTNALSAPSALLSDEGTDQSLIVHASEDGLQAVVIRGQARFAIDLALPLRSRIWYRVWASIDPKSQTFVLGVVDEKNESVAREIAVDVSVPQTSHVMFAASNRLDPKDHFTGKLEAPGLFSGYAREWKLFTVVPDDLTPRGEWDFSVGIDGLSLEDPRREELVGHVVNMPTRGVVGAFWTGSEHNWRHAPSDYAAIHFHSDDLEDCHWQPSFRFDIPEDLGSGAYAFHLRVGVAEDWLPFYVLAPRGGPYAPVVFLAPTYTYTAYANSRLNNRTKACQDRAIEWGGSAYSSARYPIYGCSTYDRHTDGSGVCFSSRLRPMLSMRPGFISYSDDKGSGLRHYPADSHLLAWLEAKGIAFDIVTDEDLDVEGSELLQHYDMVLTSTHPEYHTSRCLDGIQGYLDSGGRLAYLGGNGFYWRIARRADLPHIVEVRRAETGIRTWAAEPGEYHHMLDGALGGLWRRSRRPPQELVGIGFASQGPYAAGHYRRTKASYDPSLAWMWIGIESEEFGDYGLSGGGAAGFELDRADPTLGTPENAIILAQSFALPDGFEPVFEEMLTEQTTVSGDSVANIVRADMVYFDTPAGGSVFSVGSITFCGSLWDGEQFGGPVSTLLGNIIAGK